MNNSKDLSHAPPPMDTCASPIPKNNIPQEQEPVSPLQGSLHGKFRNNIDLNDDDTNSNASFSSNASEYPFESKSQEIEEANGNPHLSRTSSFHTIDVPNNIINVTTIDHNNHQVQVESSSSSDATPDTEEYNEIESNRGDNTNNNISKSSTSLDHHNIQQVQIESYPFSPSNTSTTPDADNNTNDNNTSKSSTSLDHHNNHQVQIETSTPDVVEEHIDEADPNASDDIADRNLVLLFGLIPSVENKHILLQKKLFDLLCKGFCSKPECANEHIHKLADLINGDISKFVSSEFRQHNPVDSTESTIVPECHHLKFIRRSLKETIDDENFSFDNFDEMWKARLAEKIRYHVARIRNREAKQRALSSSSFFFNAKSSTASRRKKDLKSKHRRSRKRNFTPLHHNIQQDQIESSSSTATSSSSAGAASATSFLFTPRFSRISSKDNCCEDLVRLMNLPTTTDNIIKRGSVLPSVLSYTCLEKNRGILSNGVAGTLISSGQQLDRYLTRTGRVRGLVLSVDHQARTVDVCSSFCECTFNRFFAASSPSTNGAPSTSIDTTPVASTSSSSTAPIDTTFPTTSSPSTSRTLHVTDYDNRKVWVTIEPDDTVPSIRSKIENRLGHPIQRAVFAGRDLNDDTIETLKNLDQQTVYLKYRAPGGAPKYVQSKITSFFPRGTNINNNNNNNNNNSAAADNGKNKNNNNNSNTIGSSRAQAIEVDLSVQVIDVDRSDSSVQVAEQDSAVQVKTQSRQNEHEERNMNDDDDYDAASPNNNKNTRTAFASITNLQQRSHNNSRIRSRTDDNAQSTVPSNDSSRSKEFLEQQHHVNGVARIGAAQILLNFNYDESTSETIDQRWKDKVYGPAPDELSNVKTEQKPDMTSLVSFDRAHDRLRGSILLGVKHDVVKKCLESPATFERVTERVKDNLPAYAITERLNEHVPEFKASLEKMKASLAKIRPDPQLWYESIWKTFDSLSNPLQYRDSYFVPYIVNSEGGMPFLKVLIDPLISAAKCVIKSELFRAHNRELFGLYRDVNIDRFFSSMEKQVGVVLNNKNNYDVMENNCFVMPLRLFSNVPLPNMPLQLRGAASPELSPVLSAHLIDVDVQIFSRFEQEGLMSVHNDLLKRVRAVGAAVRAVLTFSHYLEVCRQIILTRFTLQFSNENKRNGPITCDACRKVIFTADFGGSWCLASKGVTTKHIHHYPCAIEDSEGYVKNRLIKFWNNRLQDYKVVDVGGQEYIGLAAFLRRFFEFDVAFDSRQLNFGSFLDEELPFRFMTIIQMNMFESEPLLMSSDSVEQRLNGEATFNSRLANINSSETLLLANFITKFNLLMYNCRRVFNSDKNQIQNQSHEHRFQAAQFLLADIKLFKVKFSESVLAHPLLMSKLMDRSFCFNVKFQIPNILFGGAALDYEQIGRCLKKQSIQQIDQESASTISVVGLMRIIVSILRHLYFLQTSECHSIGNSRNKGREVKFAQPICAKLFFSDVFNTEFLELVQADAASADYFVNLDPYYHHENSSRRHSKTPKNEEYVRKRLEATYNCRYKNSNNHDSAKWKKNEELWKKNEELWKKNEELWKKNEELWQKCCNHPDYPCMGDIFTFIGQLNAFSQRKYLVERVREYVDTFGKSVSNSNCVRFNRTKLHIDDQLLRGYRDGRVCGIVLDMRNDIGMICGSVLLPVAKTGDNGSHGYTQVGGAALTRTHSSPDATGFSRDVLNVQPRNVQLLGLSLVLATNCIIFTARGQFRMAFKNTEFSFSTRHRCSIEDCMSPSCARTGSVADNNSHQHCGGLKECGHVSDELDEKLKQHVELESHGKDRSCSAEGGNVLRQNQIPDGLSEECLLRISSEDWGSTYQKTDELARLLYRCFGALPGCDLQFNRVVVSRLGLTFTSVFSGRLYEKESSGGGNEEKQWINEAALQKLVILNDKYNRSDISDFWKHLPDTTQITASLVIDRRFIFLACHLQALNIIDSQKKYREACGISPDAHHARVKSVYDKLKLFLNGSDLEVVAGNAGQEKKMLSNNILVKFNTVTDRAGAAVTEDAAATLTSAAIPLETCCYIDSSFSMSFYKDKDGHDVFVTFHKRKRMDNDSRPSLFFNTRLPGNTSSEHEGFFGERLLCGSSGSGPSAYLLPLVLTIGSTSISRVLGQVVGSHRCGSGWCVNVDHVVFEHDKIDTSRSSCCFSIGSQCDNHGKFPCFGAPPALYATMHSPGLIVADLLIPKTEDEMIDLLLTPGADYGFRTAIHRCQYCVQEQKQFPTRDAPGGAGFIRGVFTTYDKNLLNEHIALHHIIDRMRYGSGLGLSIAERIRLKNENANLEQFKKQCADEEPYLKGRSFEMMMKKYKDELNDVVG